MADAYTLFLGCLIPLRYPQIEAAARAALPALGLELADAEGFSCCPEPWNVKGTDLATWLTIALRNLAVGERAGRDLLTLCNGCFSTLTEAAHTYEHNGEAVGAATERLAALGLSYEGGTRARHVAAVLADLGQEKIFETVRKDLSKLRVAVHHGCHLLRPAAVMGFDDPFSPSRLEGLIEALGAETVSYDGYTDCCGKAMHNSLTGLEVGSDKLTRMKEAGADCVATVCPACFQQFDLGQVEMKRKLGTDHGLPAFHYLQLLALAQGIDASRLGMERHRVDVKPVLSKIGGAYG
jgi:heterodisulfide reductase subunit B